MAGEGLLVLFLVLFGLVLAHAGQGGGGLQDFLGELPLAGEQLLGEVVGAGHDLLGLGQLAGERHVHVRELGGQGLDGLDPGPDRLDDGLLALADGLQELFLQVLRGIAGHDGCLLVSFIANYIKQKIGMSSGA